MTPTDTLREAVASVDFGPDDFRKVLDDLRAIPAPLNGMHVDQHIEWSETSGPPPDAEDFALEAIYVICNSGMKHTVARGIFERIRAQTEQPTFDAWRVFKHPGKARAINEIWDRRQELFGAYMRADDKVEFCGTLPWVGPITKFHLAKNFGVDVAKPDIWLQRLAGAHGTDPHTLCANIASEVGYSVRTVDLVLWLACAVGVLKPAAHRLDATVRGEEG